MILTAILLTSNSSLLSPGFTISQVTARSSIAATSSNRNTEFFRVESLKLLKADNLPVDRTYCIVRNVYSLRNTRRNMYTYTSRELHLMYGSPEQGQVNILKCYLIRHSSTAHVLVIVVVPSRLPTWGCGLRWCRWHHCVLRVQQALAKSIYTKQEKRHEILCM